MLEKVGGTSENGAAPELDEKLLEKISYIPKVVSIEVCRYSKRTAQEFIDYITDDVWERTIKALKKKAKKKEDEDEEAGDEE